MIQKVRFLSVLLVLALAIATAACAGGEVSIQSPDDLKGKKIAVQQGTVGDELASEIENAEVKRFNRYVDAVLELKQKRADAVVMDLTPAEVFIAQNPDLAILDAKLTVEEYAIAVKKGNQELLDGINAVLADLESSGKLATIIASYDENGPDRLVFTPGTGDPLVMGTEAGFEPFEFAEGDAIVGIDVDIARAVAEAMGRQLEIRDIPFDSLIAALESGQIDFIAAGLTVNEERKQNVDFSAGYFEASQVVVVRKSSLQ